MPIVTIPSLGSVLTLDSDWSFDLHAERRNEVFGVKMGVAQNPSGKPGGWSHTWNNDVNPITLPKDTVLVVDRIYIRKGSGFSDFDSISFYVTSSPLFTGPGVKQPFKKNGTLSYGRFWAKLKDVNKIDGTWDASTLP